MEKGNKKFRSRSAENKREVAGGGQNEKTVSVMVDADSF